jgi:hypothetical protein
MTTFSLAWQFLTILPRRKREQVNPVPGRSVTFTPDRPVRVILRPIGLPSFSRALCDGW